MFSCFGTTYAELNRPFLHLPGRYRDQRALKSSWFRSFKLLVNRLFGRSHERALHSAPILFANNSCIRQLEDYFRVTRLGPEGPRCLGVKTNNLWSTTHTSGKASRISCPLPSLPANSQHTESPSRCPRRPRKACLTTYSGNTQPWPTFAG